MVVFTCSHCGDSVKKNQVEKHYQFSCRGSFPALTCVDCLKDFNGDEHVSHTSCVTEEERYSAKGFVSKAPSDKGKKKQQNWVNSLRSILDCNQKLDSDVKRLLEAIVNDSGVPQKKPKFVNFCRSKFGRNFRDDTIQRAWELMEKKKDELKQKSGSPQNVMLHENPANGVEEEDRKRKRLDSSKDCPSEEAAELCTSEVSGENSGSRGKKKKHKKDMESVDCNELGEIHIDKGEQHSVKGFVSNSSSGKRKKKQDAWVNTLRSILDCNQKLDRDVKSLLEAIVNNNSVPLKKPKFLNFCMDKFKHNFGDDTFQRAWELIEKERNELKQKSGSLQNGMQHENPANGVDEDRKRKRLHSSKDCPPEEAAELCTSEVSGENSGSRGKKKKHKDLESVDCNELDVIHTDKDINNTSKKEKKKKNKLENETLDHQPMDDVSEEKNNMDSLSKKEKKEKLKREKYEKQLLEIQNEALNNANVEEEQPNKDVEETGCSKKKKKNKHFRENNDIQICEHLPEVETKSKKKHQTLDEVPFENGDNDPQEKEEVAKLKIFNWEETVVKVLESKGELSLKRLEKKVVSEYMNSGKHVESIEKVIAKFNKKVMKMPRVKVKKDLAKLVL